MTLRRGTIEGAASGMTFFWERKYFEVTKYITCSDYSLVIFGALMNLKKWNELPPVMQKVILACSAEAQEWGRKKSGKMDKECKECMD